MVDVQKKSISKPTTMICTYIYRQGRINHSGAPYQRKAGPFSRTRSQDFLICGGALFPQKVDDLFLVVVTFKRTQGMYMYAIYVTL